MNPQAVFPDPHKLLELRGLIAGLCDAELTASQVARLEEMVCTDAACAAYYVNAMSVYATLPQHVGIPDRSNVSQLISEWQARDNDFWNDVVKAAAVLEEPACPSPFQVSPPRRSEESDHRSSLRNRAQRALHRFSNLLGVRSQTTWIALLCITSAALAGVLGWMLSGASSQRPVQVAEDSLPDTKPVARLSRLRRVAWNSSVQPTLDSPLAKGQRLSISAGVAEVTFASGAVAIVEGPVDFEIRSENEGFLHRGRTLASVPVAARGFAIETRDMRVVDLGTEFGVEVDSRRNTQVSVLRGVVDAYVAADAELRKPIRLDANKSIRYDVETRTVNQSPVDRTAFDQLQDRLNQPVVTAVKASSGKPYRIVPRGLQEDALAYIDRDYEWNGLGGSGIPTELIGADYVMTSNNDDLDPSCELQVTVAEPATLYVFFDNRAKTPEWLSRDFVDTGKDMGLDTGSKPDEFSKGAGRSIDVQFSVWKRSIEPGTTVCGPTNQPNVAHYGVAVVAGHY